MARFFGRASGVKIACIDRARTFAKTDYDKMITALQGFLGDFFVPVWQTPATLVKTRKERHDAWTLIFVDDADRAKTLGYHKLTKHGLPVARVFVTPTRLRNEPISLVASHELAEMLVDPSDNLWCMGPKRTLYAYEVWDAVEQGEFNVDGLPMSNFVYPEYFQIAPRLRVQLDHLKKVRRPFQVLGGGYMVTRVRGRKKTVFGSERKERAFMLEDRRLHRSQFR
jgi:hypothetical protein